MTTLKTTQKTGFAAALVALALVATAPTASAQTVSFDPIAIPDLSMPFSNKDKAVGGLIKPKKAKTDQNIDDLPKKKK